MYLMKKAYKIINHHSWNDEKNSNIKIIYWKFRFSFTTKHIKYIKKEVSNL